MKSAMWQRLSRWVWVGLALLMAACAANPVAVPAAQTVTITIAGSTSMTPVLQALTAEFSHQHPQVLFILRGGGSQLGEEWAAAGQVDLAASTLLPELADKAEPPQPSPARPALTRIPIGIDGVAVVVHPRNRVAVLTLLQLRDLFSGHLLSWADVGWPAAAGGGDVLLISREDGSGTRRFFEEQVMGDERVALTAVVMPTSRDVVEYVAEHPQAVGYVSAAYVRNESGGLRLPTDEAAGGQEAEATVEPQAVGSAAPQPGRDGGALAVKIMPVEGFLPVLENLSQQRYHLSQPVYLVSRGEPQGWVRQFVDFVLSPTGQGIVARYHAPVR